MTYDKGDFGGTPLIDLRDQPLDPNDPRVVELGRQMIEACKQQFQNDRDQYRALLEARVAGLEALLTAIVRQMPDKEVMDNVDDLYDNIDRAKAYLAGHGRL